METIKAWTYKDMKYLKVRDEGKIRYFKVSDDLIQEFAYGENFVEVILNKFVWAEVLKNYEVNEEGRQIYILNVAIRKLSRSTSYNSHITSVKKNLSAEEKDMIAMGELD